MAHRPPPVEAARSSSDAETTLAWIDRMVGARPPYARKMVDAIVGVGERLWDRNIGPVSRGVPRAELSPKVLRKLRFLTCNLYAAGALTSLLLSRRRPPLFAPLALTKHLAGLGPEPLAAITRLCFPALGRFVLRPECERVVAVGAFIAAIDHAFDHGLGQWAPAERGRRLHLILSGAWRPEDGFLRFVYELRGLMERGLDGPEQGRYQAALDQCHAWVDAEVASFTGVPDPRGLSHRMAGVEGTIAGIAFPLGDFLDEPARDWMLSASLFVQMFDDWVDREQDAADLRETPALTGVWRDVEVEAQWRRTVLGLEQLARASDLGRPAFVAVVRATYSEAMYAVMRAMVVGLAD